MSLKDKIAALEKRIEELEKRPPVVIHNHPQQTNPNYRYGFVSPTGTPTWPINTPTYACNSYSPIA